MRIETKRRELYAFAELSDESKKNAVDELSHINVDNDFWFEFVIDNWKFTLGTLGFYEPDIQYSGFWSQGDGASFTSKSVDLMKWLKATKRLRRFRSLRPWIESGSITASIDRISSHYVHSRTIKAVCLCLDLDSTFEEQFNQLEKELDAHAESLSEGIYASLKDEYEYKTSGDAVIEAIEANGYEFTKEGNLA